MNYKIEQDDYEYRGVKLGKMSDKGKIIGFDTRYTDTFSFIVVESDISRGNSIQDSEYVNIILEGYEGAEYVWYGFDEIEITDELTTQSQSNPIQLIRKAINGHTVKLELFSEELCVSIYDSEIPICWNKNDGVYILTETMSGNIYADMISEIAEVVKIIEDNLEWFKECM